MQRLQHWQLEDDGDDADGGNEVGGRREGQKRQLRLKEATTFDDMGGSNIKYWEDNILKYPRNFMRRMDILSFIQQGWILGYILNIPGYPNLMYVLT